MWKRAAGENLSKKWYNFFLGGWFLVVPPVLGEWTYLPFLYPPKKNRQRIPYSIRLTWRGIHFLRRWVAYLRRGWGVEDIFVRVSERRTFEMGHSLKDGDRHQQEVYSSRYFCGQWSSPGRSWKKWPALITMYGFRFQYKSYRSHPRAFLLNPYNTCYYPN